MALDPTLTAQGVVTRIRATARPGVAMSDPICTNLSFPLAPAIDAYAAILAVDHGLASPLVRATLLDVADTTDAQRPDGRFDQHDLRRFVTEIDHGAGTTFDYSRYDLNGDGRTGGDSTDRFDLDANSPAAWTTVTQTVEGSPVSFDETKLTDIRILCYYAYSFLYVGDEAQRTSLLNGRCTPVARVLAHGGTVFVDAFVQPTPNHQELLMRPNPATDLATPWEFNKSFPVTSDRGTASSRPHRDVGPHHGHAERAHGRRIRLRGHLHG